MNKIPHSFRHRLLSVLALALLASVLIGGRALGLAGDVRPALAQVPLQIIVNGPFSGAVGSPLTLSSAVTGGVSPQVTWNFGDGTATLVGQTAPHIYAAAGSYIVTATVNDTTTGQTATATTTATITAGSGTVSAGGPYTGLPGASITFTATASGFPNPQFTWNFGDSLSGAGQTLSHAYGAGGAYPVTVTVTDATTGQTGTASSVALISATGACITAVNALPLPGCFSSGVSGYPYPNVPVNPICLSGYNFAYWSYPWSLICP